MSTRRPGALAAIVPRSRPILRPLFAAEVLVDEVDPRRVSPAVLLPAEAAQVAGAPARRRREFAAGRSLARRLLRSLGAPADFALRGDAHGAPIWPDGWVGTISHTPRLATAAVARRGEVLSLGCDLAEDAPLDEASLRRICTRRERDWIAAASPGRRGRLARLVFSAKEAVYKAQHPLTGERLDYPDLSIAAEPTGDAFVAELTRDVGRWGRGHAFHGRWGAAGGCIATAITLGSRGAGPPSAAG